MKKLSIGVTLLILVTLIFLGVEAIIPSNYVFLIKAVCIVVACIDVYTITSWFQRNREEESKDKQNRMNLLISGQQKTNELFSEFEQNIQTLIGNFSSEINNRSEEEKKLVLEYINALKEELNNALGRSDEKMDNAIKGLIASEEKMSSEINNRSEEEIKLVLEYINALKEELNNTLGRSDAKMDNAIKGLIASEEKKTEEISLMMKDMSNKNIAIFEHTVEEMGELFEQENKNRLIYFEKADKQVSVNMQNLMDIQNKNANMIVKVLGNNRVLYENCMEEIRKMSTIQRELVSVEKKIREMNENLYLNLNNAVNGFVQTSENVKDEVSALKMYTKVFEDRVDTKLQEHYEKMEEGQEDGNDKLQEILNRAGENQTKAFGDQTKVLIECIEHIETVINQSINEVTSRNDRLLSYLEKIQDEWTSLNKNEIEFLNRMWEEK